MNFLEELVAKWYEYKGFLSVAMLESDRWLGVGMNAS